MVENVYSGTDVPFDCYPSLAIDTFASSPYFGSIYVAWSRYYPAGQFPGVPGSSGGSDVMFAVSNTSNGGSSWTPQMQDLVSPNTGTPVQVGGPSTTRILASTTTLWGRGSLVIRRLPSGRGHGISFRLCRREISRSILRGRGG